MNTPGSFFRFVFLLFIFYSADGSAFSLTNDFQDGFYWKEFPINLSVVDDPSYDYQKIADLEWALAQAIEQWSEKTYGIEFWRLDVPIDVSEQTKNFVKWDRNFEANSGLIGSQYLAVTIRRALIPFIARVEILMNPHYIDLDRDEIVKILVHELGHTIGLDHSVDANSIMSASIRLGPYSNQSITVDDVAGLNYIYTEMGSRQAGSSNDPAYLELQSSRDQNSSKEFVPSCGTIKDINGGGGGSGPFLPSFLFGLVFVFLFGKNFQLKLLEIID